jgi:hypothetical protein
MMGVRVRVKMRIGEGGAMGARWTTTDSEMDDDGENEDDYQRE